MRVGAAVRRETTREMAWMDLPMPEIDDAHDLNTYDRTHFVSQDASAELCGLLSIVSHIY
jgi:hypothetical protein